MSAFHSTHPSRRCQCGSAETVATFLPTGRECCGPCLVDEISDHRLIVLRPEYYEWPPSKLLMALQACPEVLPKSGVFAHWRGVLGALRGEQDGMIADEASARVDGFLRRTIDDWEARR